MPTNERLPTANDCLPEPESNHHEADIRTPCHTAICSSHPTTGDTRKRSSRCLRQRQECCATQLWLKQTDDVATPQKSCWPPLLFHMKPRRGSNFKYHFTVDCMSGQHSISSLGLWIFSFHRLAMIP